MARTRVILTIFLVLSLFAGIAQAGEIPPLGLRAAFTMERSKYYFEQYEVFTLFDLPWKARFENDWQMESKLDLGVAVIDGQGETSSKGSAAVDLFFHPPESPLYFDTSLGLGLMSDYTHGEVDFGGPVFVRFHAGINYLFSWGLSAGYKFYHESNGRMYTKNPSLNMHQFELRMNF